MPLSGCSLTTKTPISCRAFIPPPKSFLRQLTLLMSLFNALLIGNDPLCYIQYHKDAEGKFGSHVSLHSAHGKIVFSLLFGFFQATLNVFFECYG